MMAGKLGSVLVSFLAVALALDLGVTPTPNELNEAFEEFLEAAGRRYHNATEKDMRFQLWSENALAAKTLRSWTPSWGLTAEEADAFKRKSQASLTPLNAAVQSNFEAFPPAYVKMALASGINWAYHGRVTEAKSQGSHPFCGTFMRVAVAEGQWARFSKTLVALSEQQLISCTPGSDYQYAAIDRTGLMSESSYPYVLSPYAPNHPPACKQDLSKIVARGFTEPIWTPFRTDEEQLAAFVFHNGPMGIGIMSKVFESADKEHWVTNCANNMAIDHGITIVGFGNHPERGRFWIIKNSWGKNWQDNGFAYIPFGVSCGGINFRRGEMIAIGDHSQYFFGHPVVHLLVKGRQCKTQTAYLGTFDKLEDCAVAAAANPRCSGYLMWPTTYKSWGCRCCADETPGYVNSQWSVYSYSSPGSMRSDFLEDLDAQNDTEAEVNVIWM